VEYENNQRRFESVYSTKVRAGKRRTYFFDVRKTKGEDFYITLTESTKRFDSDGYERHKIFLYKEDFNRFLTSLGDAINHVKTELMPDYDYDEFTRRQEEWEIKRAAMDKEALESGTAAAVSTPAVDTNAVVANNETDSEESIDEVSPAEPADIATSVETSEDDSPSFAKSEEESTSPIDGNDATSENLEEISTSENAEESIKTSSETDEEDMSW